MPRYGLDLTPLRSPIKIYFFKRNELCLRGLNIEMTGWQFSTPLWFEFSGFIFEMSKPRMRLGLGRILGWGRFFLFNYYF